MTADDVFAEAMADLTDEIGSDAVYTYGSSGEYMVDCKVLVEQEVVEQGGGQGALVQVTTIEARLAEVGQEPDRGDTFAVGATTYTVEDVLENDGTWVKVAVR